MLRNRNKRPSEEDSPGPKAKNKRDGTMKVAGRLVQVDLENFMCHGNLRVNFDVENHNCLYIGGPNGSGKSALFAAINIGLGGAGRGNERGNSVQMYIKTGKSRAKTRITLTNTGEGSFEDYDRIIVERTILEAGGSYSIKGVRGGAESLIPGGKTTLNKIISRYGIELNNPIYWLSQDRARKFLADTNPKQLFQIFADASELDTTLANYNEIGTHMHAINGNLTNLTRILAGLREDYRKKQAIMTRRQKEIALIGEIQILHWFSQFSPLRDIEEAETELKRRIEENKAAHRKLKQKHKDEAVELAQWREELENLAAKTSEKRGEVDDLERQLADYEDQMVPYNEELKDLERKIQRANQDIEQSDATIRDAKRKIRQEKEKLAKNQDRHQMEELQVKVTELEKLEAANRDEIQKTEHKMETMKPAVREAHTAAFEASNQAQQQRVEHQQLTREIGSIQERSKNNLSRFGPTIPQVVQKINEQAARFSVKPKGPMGSYIQVRDKKYQLAVEQALRRQLGTFIFANRKDELLFIRMMEHYGIHCPPTTVVKFGQEPHSTSDNEPPGRVATVLRMIDVTDNDVRNTLIDATGMECIALFDSDQEAREIMNGSAPQNCNTAYTCSGAEVHGKSARGGTQYRFYACHQRHATILADSSNANIEDLTRQLEVAKRQYDMANETARNKNSRSDQLKRQYELLKRQKDDLEDKLRRYESQKTRIRREIATIVDREDGNVVIGVQQRLLGEVEESKAQLLGKRDQLEDEKRKKQRKLAKMEGHRKAFQQNASDHAQEMDETESVAEGLKLKIQQLSGKIQESEAQMRQLEEKVRKWTEEDAVSIERRKDEALAKLNEEEVNPPPNYPDRPDFRDIPETRELLSMMKKRESELNGVREALGEAPTEEHLKQIKDKFEAGRKDYVALRNINEMLQKTLILRKKKFPVFRHGIISRVKDAFQDLIRYKFEGEMLINTEQRTININIKPHSSNPKEKLKDIRGLSGGEKSYTTTCFLMALWTIMETPFRCMDEFDVFMDGHMRKTAMDLIVAEATRKYKHQQFIFFTPQGINEIKKDNTDNQVATFEMPKVRE